MIAVRPAAILRFAAWAGALLGGAADDARDRWADFGMALAFGFQIRDDLLGIWGAADETGKAPADDIRRRKKSLPVLLLRERLTSEEREALARLYATESIDRDGIAEILALLEREAIQHEVARDVARYHDEAARALGAATGDGANPYRDLLLALVERLAARKG